MKDGDGAWPKSVMHEPQELVHAPDMAPAKNLRQLVLWARVGISICEQVCGRVDKSLRKSREKGVRHTLLYRLRHMLRTSTRWLQKGIYTRASLGGPSHKHSLPTG